MRQAVTVLTCVVVSLGAIVFSATARAEAKRPNVIFIFSDDHAAQAISAYGSKVNKTPHIDRLAKEGVLFRNCFCTNSICGPSRAVILTGKHSHLNGFRTNRDRFDGSQQTFPKLLQTAGYQTAMIGKWHLKSDPTGFDYWRVLIGQGPYYNPPMSTPDGRVNHTGYTTSIITDLGLEWLKSGRDATKPFMLMLQHKAPHRNWQPGPGYLDMYDDVKIPEPATLFDDWAHRTSAAKTQTMTVARHLSANDLKLTTPKNLTPKQLAAWKAAYDPKNAAFKAANLEGDDLVRWKYQRYMKDYLRCVAAVDDGIGQVLACLDETGLAENTIVIYSSDQGFYLGEHGWFDKRWMYEESLRMPFLVRWPGVIRAGTENRDLVQNLDFAPTFLELAGVDKPADMQGESLVPLLRGEQSKGWRESIYYHYYEFPGAHSVRRHYGVRTQRHKLIKYYGIDEWELFDLDKDPDELRSVWAESAYGSVRKELEAEIVRLQGLYADTAPESSLRVIDQKRVRRRARSVKLEQVFAVTGRDAKIPAHLDPSAKPLTVGAHATPQAGDGVLVAQGGESYGYALYLKDGAPVFAIRNSGELVEVRGKTKLPLEKAVHIVGMLDAKGAMRLFVNAAEVAQKKGKFLLQKPSDGLTLGQDGGSRVGAYDDAMPFQGTLRDVRLFWGALPLKGIRAWSKSPAF